jgi:hypothetical protein
MSTASQGGQQAKPRRTDADLLTRWRSEAASLDSWGAQGQATILRRCADELEKAQRDAGDELVTLTEGSRRCKYTADHLGRLVSKGKLKNYGRPNAPLVRVSDLPRKAGTLPAVPYPSHVIGATCREIARAVVSETES